MNDDEFLDDQLAESTKRDFEKAFIGLIQIGNYGDAIVFSWTYKKQYPEESTRLDRCEKELKQMTEGELLHENVYYFEDEGMTKLDFKS